MRRGVVVLLCAACLTGVGCPKTPRRAAKKTSAAQPGPPGSVPTAGAVERAKQWIRSGGTDTKLVHPQPGAALAGFSMTTPLDLSDKAVKSVTLRGAVGRGPGRVAGMETFTMHDGRGTVFERIATYEVTFELALEGGGATQEVTVSLRPYQGQWYVLAPAKR